MHTLHLIHIPRDMPTIAVATKGKDALNVAPSGRGGWREIGVTCKHLKSISTLSWFLGLMGERKMHVKQKFAMLGKYDMMVERS